MNKPQGMPLFFDVDVYLDVVEMMINADEVERAIHMLDNMPAYYRDHMPLRAHEIRLQLHANLVTTEGYKKEYELVPLDPNAIKMVWPHRAQMVEAYVRNFNRQGMRPHLMEFAPGSGYLPFYLNELGLDFSYEERGIDRISYFHKTAQTKSSPKVFIAFEVIEHLANPFEIYQNYAKFGVPADYVFLSTPLYTINGGEDKWRERLLGHLRTYTPDEFKEISRKMFLNYTFAYHLSDTITLVGKRPGFFN